VELKETKEVLRGVDVLATKIIARIADGVGVDDAIALATDGELRAAVTAAVNGIGLVDDELRDLTLDETAELIAAVTPVVLNIIKAIRTAAAKKAA
jgi:hypothetical protein